MKYTYIALLLLCCSCKQFIEVPSPTTEIRKDIVFNNDGPATSAILDIYTKFQALSTYIAGGSYQSLSYLGGMLADEFIYTGANPETLQYYTNQLLPSSSNVYNAWSTSYALIYSANAVIEGLEASTGVTPALRTRLIGEAKFLRAFCHFYLVSLFGDVPYIRTTDYKANAMVSRMPIADVYQQIIADLKEAETLIPEEYPTANRVRANKWCASALMARTYLCAGDWANAAAKASELIAHTDMYGLVPLADVFSRNNRGAIFQLYPETGANYANEAEWFVLTESPARYSLDTNLLKSFEPADQRVMQWIGTLPYEGKTYYFSYKYREGYANSTGREFSTIMRMAEQYLIRAEARARQQNIPGAQDDLDAIRINAGLNGTAAAAEDELIDAILEEYRHEYFAEWGQRWLSLKRTGKADATLSHKLGWNATDTLFPIPSSEISVNNNIKQNKGYY